MRLKEIVAYEIFKIREEWELDGNLEHDWWLAEEFLKEHKDKFDTEDIYSWIIQREEFLDENNEKMSY